MFAIGDAEWPGVSKLAEECGEVLTEIGKLMGSHGDPNHWSGNLRERLINESADNAAALLFFVLHNLSQEERTAYSQRVLTKLAKFEEWHANPTYSA